MNKNPWFTTESMNEDFRITFYTDNSVGMGFNKQSKEIRNHNNHMQFNDHQYGWIDVVAVNINQVKMTRSGWTYDLYGSVIELTYPNGTKKLAVIADSCGSSRTKAIIDLWLDKNDYSEHINEGVNWQFIRKGLNGKAKFKF